jgi:hypothetical protein
MPIGQDEELAYQAINPLTGDAVSNDQANHTLKLIAGVTESALNVTITPLSNGRYGVTVPGNMNTSRFMQITGSSSTTNVKLLGVEWENEDAAGPVGTLIDHNYTGTDALRVVKNSVGVGGVSITAYLQNEWDAGVRDVVDSAVTGSDGRWQAAMRLEDGNYVLLFEKPGVIQSNTVQIAVPTT